MNKPIKLGDMKQARAYVAGAVAMNLRNDFDNGSDYLFEGDGNLADEFSQRRAHKAARQLIAKLEKIEAGASSGGK
jgi:hypothetical protein